MSRSLTVWATGLNEAAHAAMEELKSNRRLRVSVVRHCNVFLEEPNPDEAIPSSMVYIWND